MDCAEAKPVLHGEKPGINHLSYGMGGKGTYIEGEK
jgi:hypothetical protein